MAVGVALSAGVGAATHDLAMGTAIGVALGVAIGMANDGER